MLTQQEDPDTIPVERGSAMKAALTERLPRAAIVAMCAGLVPFAAGMTWVILSGADEPRWAGPWPLLPTMVTLVVLGLALSLMDKHWARAGARTVRLVISLHILSAGWRWLEASDAPVWAVLAVYGGTATIVGAMLAGAVANYRSAGRRE